MRSSAFVRCSLIAIGALWSVDAFANTYIIEQSQSRYIHCYNQVYVPAQVQVNTRGRLVRGASRGFEVVGNGWNYVENPPVYIETQRVVSPDHYTLVTSACPAD